MSIAKPKGGREHGAAMVEFALVFMLLFTLVTLFAEGGLLFSTWLAVTNGAREGARFAAPCLNRTVEPCPESTVVAVVDYYTAGFLDQTPPLGPTPVPGVIPCPTPTNGYRVCVDDSAVKAVTVRVWGTMSSVTPILGDLTVYGESTMRLENQPTATPPPK